MPHLIHLAVHPPRFIRGGIRIHPRRELIETIANEPRDHTKRITTPDQTRESAHREQASCPCT